MKTSSYFSNFKIKIKVGFFGVGAMISSVGQIVYGLKKFLKYFAVKNPFVYQPIIWVGTLTTLYVRGKTRFPALWKQFSPNKKNDSVTLNKCQKCMIGGTTTSGIISGLSNGGQSYLGGTATLELLTINNNYADYFVGSYSALTSLMSFYAFFVQNSIENAKTLSQIKIKDENIHVKTSQIIWSVIKTTFVSTFGAAALGAFAFFTLEGLMEDLPDHVDDKIPEAVQIMIPTLGLIATVITTLLSRVAETYKYFSTEKALNFEGLSARRKLELAPGLAIGPLDILAFMMTLYIGCISTAQSYNLDKNPIVTQTCSIFAAMSGGFLHYVFSVRKIIKTDIENSKKEQLIELTKQHINDKILTDGCCTETLTKFSQIFKSVPEKNALLHPDSEYKQLIYN